MYANGTLFPLVPLVPHTKEAGSICWPTPTACDWKGASKAEHCKAWEKRGTNLPEAVQLAAIGDKRWPQPEQRFAANGPLNPPFVEWLMGFPIGWTDCDALETQ
jgi:DNA (cytosine-5)-methyltransferase 1